MLNIQSLRKEYQIKSLDIKDLNKDPLEQFNQWFLEAQAQNVLEPNAMILATASKNAAPSSRTVLLKQVDQGFVFYTNYNSRKAQELSENPLASVTFLWKEIERQIIIEGNVQKTSRQESIDYFKKRPRTSQIGAWASHQDQPLLSREELEQAFAKLEYEFQHKEIPIPENWGGFRLYPTRFEFWQGRQSRLHDRFCYTQKEEVWQINRLAP